MSRNPLAQIVLEELSQAGIAATVEYGAKHLRIRWIANGRNRSTFVAKNGRGSWDAPRAVRTQIRRTLRADAVLS